jgi:hypothetical protein
MMRTRWTTRMMVLGAAAVLTLAACGSDDGSDDAGDGDGGSGDEEAYESPIADFLGIDTGPSNPEDAEREFADQEQQRQEQIAACMQEQGFEYVAYVDPDMVTFVPTSSDGLEWGSEEWVRKYGYGVTTQWFSQEAVGPDLVGYESHESESDESGDPNTEIYESLSESEREAYDVALWGDPDDQPVFDETLTEEEMEEQFAEWEPTGCSAEADADVYGFEEANSFYMEYSDEMQEMYEAMLADPRVVELEQETSDCVTDRGLEYVSENDYWEEMNPIREELEAGVELPGMDLSAEEMDEMTAEEVEEMFSQPENLTDDVKARLAELQEEEIALAVAVYECGGGTQQNEELFEEIRVEYEQQFLDDHADELESFKGDDTGE